jgi:hypothetical protein
MLAGQEADDLGKAPVTQDNRWKNIKTGEEGRHHVHESVVQKAVAGAVRNHDDLHPRTQQGFAVTRLMPIQVLGRCAATSRPIGVMKKPYNHC